MALQQFLAALKGQKELYRRFKESFLDSRAVDFEESSAVFLQAKERVLLHLKSQHSYKQPVDPRGALARLRQHYSDARNSLQEAKESRTEKLRNAYQAVKQRRRAQALPEALDESKILGKDGLLRGLVLASVGGACKLFLHGLSDVRITGAEHFRQAMERPAGQALVTVSNHVAAADDPAITAALMPAKSLLDQRAVRWTMCATDRCFTSPTMIPFFRAAKVLPVERGAGVDQVGMRKAAEVLNKGDWVHIFPEGTRTKDGRIGPARRGVGHLISSCDHPPQVLPFVHSGLDKVFPGKAKLPRPGQTVRVLVGEPIHFEDLTATAQQRRWSQESLQAAITARIGHTLCALKAELDGVPIADVMSSQAQLDSSALRPLIVEEADSMQHSWTNHRWPNTVSGQAWAPQIQLTTALLQLRSTNEPRAVLKQTTTCLPSFSQSWNASVGASPSMSQVQRSMLAWQQNVGQMLWPNRQMAM